MIARRFGIPSVIAVVHDFLAVAVAWWLAYLLLFDFEIPASSVSSLNKILPWVMFAQAGICLWQGLYRGVWRYASLPDLKRILLAVSLGGIIAFAIIRLLELSDDIPHSIILLASILLLLIMGGSRLLYRAWKERRLYSLKNYEGKLVLVLGAGRTTISLVKDLERSRDWHIAGLLDDDPRKVGTRLHGVRVLGAIKDLPFWAHKLNVAHVIIAMPLVSHRIHRQALALCTEIGVKAMTVPSYIDLISGKTTVSQIRSIELDDLLGRAPVVLDDVGLYGLLSERTILITGAGGSIGSELCRQIITFKPDRLVLLELNEFALYSIEEEFRSTYPDINISFVIGDVKDAARLKQLFSQFHPTIVFHAAAYKHVPLMESENAWQAMLNNVMGTYVLAKTAMDFAVDEFVLISTDKAVNPVNIMGASKRLAEMVCQAMQTPNTSTEIKNSADKKKKTCFVMVRFGNVLGSAGSVIPKFREQIGKGGPITITHPEMTRYFMSIPEATQLVLQAGSMGGVEGGGEIFVLDMGDPVKIIDLASDLIRLSGLTEDDIKITYTGLRSGEKLHEELLTANENTLPTPHAKLRIAQARQVDREWLAALVDWFEEQTVLSDEEVRQQLKKWVPEYSKMNVEGEKTR